MSRDPSALLATAHTIISEQIGRLRDLHRSAQERLAQLEQKVRAAERQLDELLIQSRFAAERGLPTAEAAAARERQSRTEHEALAAEYAELRRALRQLDQLVRQIDMSSATLSGTVEGEPADPWVQALRAQVIMGREDERHRLAREVHDGPAQVLANMLMGLERSQTLLADGRQERLGSLLAQMSEAAREGLHEVRGFIADLRPARLDEQGLVGALQEYLRRYRDRVNAAVSFDADPLPRLPAEAEIVLYRVVQESLQNARKHARGAPVHIIINVRKNILTLTVRDEGPGFDPREVARRAGRESWGLTSMRERAELIGARFVVTTRPGHGTEVALRLPVLLV
ncbi:MAG: sensor histidine kinase [Candidatus Viridilinea halotolerans]|uniref:Sensor histidine kinase n=1 Tax=Candidatus Viridilinea halotolerans TaxID=2491704 RepID=A0A426U6S6_9CHLR|nr:MAG: sensor histidine kinase [Candidatus Viridilinea halotolerans]